MANFFFITGTKENAFIHLMSNRLLAASAFIARNPQDLQSSYHDRQLGYPKRIFIDPAQSTAVRRIPELPQPHF